MFRRVAKDTNSRYKRVLWTILALAIGPLVWVVWCCRQRGRDQSALSEPLLVDAGDSSTAARACTALSRWADFELRLWKILQLFTFEI